ncbi:MAG TPA: hypothetical protein VJZ06_03105 [Mobilitalea sp.]|nr:hypothetical protein [Mobilitalea sp.]
MKKLKRIGALFVIVLILSLFILLLISALFTSEKAPSLFLASVFSIITIPILIFGLIATYKYVHRNDKPEIKESDEHHKDDSAN